VDLGTDIQTQLHAKFSTCTKFVGQFRSGTYHEMQCLLSAIVIR